MGNVCLLLNNDSHLWLSGLTFGNYVIQCIIKRGTSYSNDAVIARFRRQLITDVFADSDQLLLLSKDKHGSNVIEACIRAAEEPDLDVLVGNICKKCGYLLRELIRGEFSNYVPKTLIKFCNRSQQEELVACVHHNITSVYQPSSQYWHCSEFLYECSEVKYRLDRARNPTKRGGKRKNNNGRVYRSYNQYKKGKK